MRLNVKAFGLALGIIWGLIVFAATIIMILRGTPAQLMGRLGVFYPGYKVTYVGSIIGFVYSLVYGYIAGAIFAWLYNKLSGNRIR